MLALRLLVCTGVLGLFVVVNVSPGARAEEPDLSGTWVWTWKDPTGGTHWHVLEVEGTGAALAARERFDDEAPVKAAEFHRDGKNVRLTVVRGDRRAEYRGVLAKADTINGTVTVKQGDAMNNYPWDARRQATPP